MRSLCSSSTAHCFPMILFSSSSNPYQNPIETINVRKAIRCGSIEASIMSRREAVGFGVSLVVLLHPKLAAGADDDQPATCDQLTSAPSGLAFCDKVLGSGPQALKGQLIKAHYVGRLENGKVFDSSYNRGKPLTFRVGVGEVIKGWDEGISGSDGVPAMLAGGKRLLRIPPKLGYGTRGAGCKGGSCVIPPDSVLVFDVELLGKP